MNQINLRALLLGGSALLMLTLMGSSCLTKKSESTGDAMKRFIEDTPLPEGTTSLAADGATLSWKDWEKQFENDPGATKSDEYFMKNLSKELDGKDLLVDVNKGENDKASVVVAQETQKNTCSSSDPDCHYNESINLGEAVGLNMDNFHLVHRESAYQLFGFYTGNEARWFVRFDVPGDTREVVIQYTPVTEQQANRYSTYLDLEPETLLNPDL